MRTLKRRRLIAGSAALLIAVMAALASSAQAGPGVTVRRASAGESAANARMLAAAKRLGLPPGGPTFLYTPRPEVPQLQNRGPRFRAAFNPVSGTERYTGGEYEYTDFLYDDEATTYPDDFRRYAGNAGDLSAATDVHDLAQAISRGRRSSLDARATRSGGAVEADEMSAYWGASGATIKSANSGRMRSSW